MGTKEPYSVFTFGRLHCRRECDRPTPVLNHTQYTPAYKPSERAGKETAAVLVSCSRIYGPLCTVCCIQCTWTVMLYISLIMYCTRMIFYSIYNTVCLKLCLQIKIYEKVAWFVLIIHIWVSLSHGELEIETLCYQDQTFVYSTASREKHHCYQSKMLF